MALKKRSYRKRVSRGKKRVVGGRRKSSVSVGVKKYVNRIVHSQIENKSTQINAGFNFGNILESPELNAYPMCPHVGFWTINQGVLSNNRIGNQIKVRKIHLNYVLRPAPYDVTFNAFPTPVEVQLFLGYVKDTPTITPTAFDFLQIVQSGASAANFTGSLRDIVAVMNKDYWVIKKRWTHKIGYAAATGSGSNASAQFNSNNDFKLNVVRRMDITKFAPKLCQFNDSTTTPTSKNLYFFQQAVWANGSTSGATTLTTSIDFWIDFEYEDA